MPMHGELTDSQRREAWRRSLSPLMLFIGGSYHRQLKAVPHNPDRREPLFMPHNDRDHVTPITLADLDRGPQLSAVRMECYTRRTLYCPTARVAPMPGTRPEERTIEFYAIESMDDFEAISAAIFGLD